MDVAPTSSKRTIEYGNDDHTSNETNTDENQLRRQPETNKEPTKINRVQSFRQSLSSFYEQNEFLILVVTAIGLARAYPPLGAEYLYPKITATWVAIIFIFLLSGINLPMSEFVNVLRTWRFNLFIQFFSFGVSSAITFAMSRALYKMNVLSIELANGMTLVGTLPMTINSADVLTKCAKGDEVAALLNSVTGNMIGIFISPVLLLLYINLHSNINAASVFVELALRVIMPTIVGQILQKTTNILFFMAKHKNLEKRLHQFAMVYVVYIIFCRTFQAERDGKISEIFLMIAFQLLLLLSLMGLAWVSLFWASPKQRVFGLFGCTHKSMAIGILLVDALFGNEPNAGLYALPLVVYHPMQLVLGTIAVPHLEKYVLMNEEANVSLSSDDVSVSSEVSV